MQIQQLFDGLAKSWSVKRIVDGITTVSGTASFKSSQSNELHYIERGFVKLASGKQLAARQSYIYKLDGSSISVFFDEEPQRLFHRIEFEDGADGSLNGRGSHQCKEDLYQICYIFYPHSTVSSNVAHSRTIHSSIEMATTSAYLPRFQIEYTIDGPSKHSIILCRYQAT